MSKKGALGVFSLAMMNCVAIISLRNFPSMAEYGLAMIFFYTIAVILFLIPTALVSAELATGFPEEGGIFNWVNKAMGNTLGFLSIWIQNICTVVSAPAALVYMASLIAYAIGRPDLASNNYYAFAVTFVATWLCTLICLKGMRFASLITNIGSVLGTFIPIVLIVVLGSTWLIAGHPSFTPLTWSATIPNLDSPEKFVFLLNVLLGFSGLEISAALAKDVKNPQRDYPRAIFISAILIFGLSLFGSLAIAVSVPKESLTLESGVIQSIQALLEKFHLSGMTSLIAWLMALGVLAWFVAWLAGPSLGMLAMAKVGNLPPVFQKVNRNGMPTALIIFQGCLITISSVILLLIPSVTTCFWISVAASTQCLLIMYILMFLSGIILKFKYPKTPRAYAVPFGKIGMTLTSGLAIIACILCFFVGFLPPEEIHFDNKIQYIIILLIGNLIVMLPPFVIAHFRKPEWKREITPSADH